MIDTYKTIEIPGKETLFKEKNSKFFGYAFPVQSEEEVKMILEQVKKQHFSARHWCYAYQTGTGKKIYFRANDDRSEERRVGKEGRYEWPTCHEKKRRVAGGSERET